MADRDIQLRIDTVVDATQAAKSLDDIKKSISDIEKLQSQIGDKSSVEYKKLADAAENALQKQKELQLQSIETSAENIKTAGQLKRVLTQIALEQEKIGDTSSESYKRLQSAAESATNSFNKTAQTAAQVRDAVGDVQDKVRTLEGTPIERLRGSFGLLQDAIFNLDFDKAKIGLEGISDTLAGFNENKFIGAVQNISSATDAAGEAVGDLSKNVGGLGGAATTAAGGMGGLGGASKSLGSILGNIGKSLLTNPIFLLAAAIAAIVAVVLILMNKLGLVKPIMDAIGKATQFVVDAFNALTDAMGLTSIAAEKEAEAIKNAEEKKEKARQKGVEASKKAADIEREYQYEQLEQIENLKDREIRRAELDAKWRKKDLEDRLWDMKKELEENEKNGEKNIVQQNAYNSAKDYTEKQFKLADEKLKREKERINKEHNDKIAEDNKKADDARKARAAENLSNLKSEYKLIIDENNKFIEKTQPGTQERLDAVKKGQERELEFIKKHHKDLNINLEDFQKEQAAIYQKELDDYAKIQEKKRLSNEVVLKEIAVLEANAVMDKAENEEQKVIATEAALKAQNDLIRAKLDQELSDETLTEDQKKLMRLQAEQEIQDNIEVVRNESKEREAERLLELQSIRDEFAITQEQNEISRLERELERENLTKDEKMRLMQELSDAKIRLLQEEERQALISLDAEYQQRKKLAKTPEEALLIDQWYAGERLRITGETEAAVQETQNLTTQNFENLKNQELSKALETAQKTLDFTQKISDLGFAIFKNTRKKEANESDAQRKKRLQEEDKAARIQFAINKGIQLGTAVINGIQSILAITSVPDFTLGVQSAIRIAGQVALNALSIAKIASTQYQPAGGGADTGSVGAPPTAPAGGGGMAAPTTPQIPAFTPAQFFNVGQQQPGGAAAAPPIQVVVTETDITQTQTRVRVIEDRATIG